MHYQRHELNALIKHKKIADRLRMRTRVYNNKEQIFCEWRHRWVRLTPEEWVRQNLLHHMVEKLDYPASLIAVEQAITIGDAPKRCDAILYNRNMRPIMLIECKAQTVPLSQATLDQAVTYNRKLNVPYMLLYNGVQTIFIDGNNYIPTGLPRYSDLLRRE